MTWEIDEKKKICAVCKIVAKQRCSDCKITYYCSREHQKSDWQSHSTKCRVLKLIEDTKLGRCYVAARKIETEEVVLYEEKPLLITPLSKKSPVCLNCYVPLNSYNAKSCDKCGWPLCKDCNVHGPECELTMKYRKSKMTIHEYSKVLPIYNAICVLRALALRDKCPSDYDKLMNLESHCEKNHQDWRNGISAMSIYEEAKIVKMGMDIDNLDVDKIARIIGIMNINACAVLTPAGHVLAAIFAKSSYVSHDCVPNCSVIFSRDDNVPTITIRAIRKIEKGNLITITYTYADQGTALRQYILRISKFFYCTCERCKDPTELGTMFSAIKCFKEDCKGHMLPSTFLIFKDQTPCDYVCDKCNSTRSWMTVNTMIVEIAKKFSEVDKKNVNQLKKFIDEQTNILHENHFYMLDANCKLLEAWAMMMRNNLTCLTEEFLKKNIALCKKIIHLYEVLMPSFWGMRGSFLIKLVEYRWLLQNQMRFHRESQSQNLDILKENREMLREADRLLSHEPKNSRQGQINELALSMLRKVHSTEFFPQLIP